MLFAFFLDGIFFNTEERNVLSFTVFYPNI